MSTSVYESVTNGIIEELKQGVVPWVRPWKAGGSSPFPHNAISERPYHGVNVLLLWKTAAEQGYENPAWLTFKQAQALGGSIKRGEHATAIVYAATTTKVEESETGEDVAKDIHFLKFYSVFNVEQTTGLPERLTVRREPKSMGERLFRAEVFVGRIGSRVFHGGNQAFYKILEDVIWLPKMEDFESLGHYFATNLHEHVHWSGHPSRLNRVLGNRFGTRAYAAEELIAELGAAYLCALLGIKGELRHASYIASWLELLENDRKAIFTAAAAASKAVDYLWNLGVRKSSDEAQDAGALAGSSI